MSHYVYLGCASFWNKSKCIKLYLEIGFYGQKTTIFWKNQHFQTYTRWKKDYLLYVELKTQKKSPHDFSSYIEGHNAKKFFWIWNFPVEVEVFEVEKAEVIHQREKMAICKTENEKWKKGARTILVLILSNVIQKKFLNFLISRRS